MSPESVNYAVGKLSLFFFSSYFLRLPYVAGTVGGTRLDGVLFPCSGDLISRIEDKGFPGSSAGKESTCNAGDPSLIPGSGRSAGEGIGYPLQYSWTSLVAQLVKNPHAVWETWVGSLGWKDPLEKGKATHSSMLAWRVPQTVQSMGITKSRTQQNDFHFLSLHYRR